MRERERGGEREDESGRLLAQDETGRRVGLVKGEEPLGAKMATRQTHT